MVEIAIGAIVAEIAATTDESDVAISYRCDTSSAIIEWNKSWNATATGESASFTQSEVVVDTIVQELGVGGKAVVADVRTYNADLWGPRRDWCTYIVSKTIVDTIL